MFRQQITAAHLGHYRSLIELDRPFTPPPVPEGFDYEQHLDRILDEMWSGELAAKLGLPRDWLKTVPPGFVLQEKRNLLDVALSHGAPSSVTGTIVEAVEVLRHAEAAKQAPFGLRVSAYRIPPVRIAHHGPIEVWQGHAALIPCDLASSLTDLDLVPDYASAKDTHELAGPRLRIDCARLKEHFDCDFVAGSVLVTRGYFSRARYIAHVVPPWTDNGIWKHTVRELRDCYRNLFALIRSLNLARVAIQVISLGNEAQALARTIAIDSAREFCRTPGMGPLSIGLVASDRHTAFRLADELRYRRLPAR